MCFICTKGLCKKSLSLCKIQILLQYIDLMCYNFTYKVFWRGIMSKTVLTIDDINLLKNSEEPKNTELYGNLYDVLCTLQNPKAVSLEQLQNLNGKGIAALTYNKKTLIDTVIKEWYAERVSEEDPAKHVRCGLCNTPNKYLYYIRNRKNGIVLNVGSHCITKFPGIEGYVEQKKQLSQIYKGRKVIERRSEFYNRFQDVEQFISDADKYFTTLPILLPYDLYTKLSDTITRMRLIYTKYINEGKKPFKSEMSSLDLFQLAIDQYNKLKVQADTHISSNLNNPLVCKRKEIDWLISNGKNHLLKSISENNGIYAIGTLKYIAKSSIVEEHKDKIVASNQSSLLKIEKISENNILFTFNKHGYQPSIILSIKLSDFMLNIGAMCIIDSNFKYGNKEIISIANISNSAQNLSSVINYTDNIMNKFNCCFLVDDTTNTLFLYRKGDKAIKTFIPHKFLSEYCKYLILSDDEIKNYLFSIIKGTTNTKWISQKVQSQQGISDKISKLYKEYIDNRTYFLNYDRHNKYIEIITYNITSDSELHNANIDFDSPEFIKIAREKIKLSDNSLRTINYAVRIKDDSLNPYYHKGDLLLLQNTQTVRDGNIIFYITSDGFFTNKCHIKQSEESTESQNNNGNGFDKIFNYIEVSRHKLKSFGRIAYLLREK